MAHQSQDPLDTLAESLSSDDLARLTDELRRAEQQAREAPTKSLYRAELVFRRVEGYLAQPIRDKDRRTRLLLLASRTLRHTARVNGELGRPDLAVEQLLRARTYATRALESARDDGAVFAILSSLLQLGWCWYGLGEEEHLRLAKPRQAVDSYGKAADIMQRAAVLATNEAVLELARAVGFPAQSLAVDVHLSVARIHSLRAFVEKVRLGSAADALRSYDRAAATALKALAAAQDQKLTHMQPQAWEAASDFLVEAGRIAEGTGQDFEGAGRRFLIASRFAARAGKLHADADRPVEAARSLVAASHAAYRAALCLERTGGRGVIREFERAADLAHQAAQVLQELGLSAAYGQAILAVGRIWLACGRHLERQADTAKALDCFRRAMAAVAEGHSSLPDPLVRELRGLRHAAEHAIARLRGTRQARWSPGVALLHEV